MTTPSQPNDGDSSGSSPPGPSEPATEVHGSAVPGERLGVPLGAARVAPGTRVAGPSYVFLAVVSLSTLVADILTKSWAEKHLARYPGSVELWPGHITLILAKNRGGAWGLLQTTSENVRRPFFLLVSVAAIAFIMSLYRRLEPRQFSLKWGLPLVLGGALGNVLDRVRYGHVIDFIDAHVLYKAVERHWPTFNVADIAICVGVGLMALDMFGSKRGPSLPASLHAPPAQSGEPVPDWSSASGHASSTASAHPEPDPTAPAPTPGGSR